MRFISALSEICGSIYFLSPADSADLAEKVATDYTDEHGLVYAFPLRTLRALR